VTGLAGENGAGKSTLIRIIGGLESPTSGQIFLRDTPVDFPSARDSQDAGISVVSQEFRLVPQLTVAENIFLGHELTRAGLVDRKLAHRRTTELLGQLDLELDPARKVSSLTVGDQQLVEIARSLSREFDVLVLDEPTAALNGVEVERLLALVRKLRDAGKAILYVSHHLDEIFAISDEIVVLRDGQRVGHLDPATASEGELVDLMLGKKFAAHTANKPIVAESSAPILSVEGLVVPGVSDLITLKVGAGEIVGIAGLVGSGRSEVMRALFGVLPPRGGSISVKGRALRLGSPSAAIEAGIFMLSEDRKASGIVPHLTVLENLVLSKNRPSAREIGHWLPVQRHEMSLFQQLKEQLSIRVTSAKQLIGNLSGGNQQKVLFGRAVLSGCPVLLLNEPTRGVDVGAKAEIYELIEHLAAQGVAVIVSSSEAPELAILAHRCLVLYAGRVLAELSGSDVTESEIVAASVGQSPERAA
jgi:ABC-type sugar transport system ATPase subunit